MKTHRMRALMLAMALSLVLLACPPQPPPTDVVIDVLIGVSSSGSAGAQIRPPGLASWAQAGDHWLYEAVRLAVAQMTDEGTLQLNGRPARVQLIFVDDQGDPARAREVALGLVEKGVVAVIGHLTPETALEAASIYADADVLYMSPVISTLELATPDLWTTHLMQAEPRQIAQASAVTVYHTLNGRRVGLIMQAGARYVQVGEAWAETFKALGGEIVYDTVLDAGVTDVTPFLRVIQEQGGQAIIYSGEAELGAQLARAAQEMGLPQRVIGFQELVSDTFIQLADTRGEGTLAFSPRLGERADIYQKYLEMARAAGTSTVSPNAPYAYDAARFVLKAVQAAGSNEPAEVSQVAQDLAIDGLTGPVAFFEDGRRIAYPVTLYEATPADWTDKATVIQPADTREPGEWVPNGDQELPAPLPAEPTADAREELLGAYRKLRELQGFRHEMRLPVQISAGITSAWQGEMRLLWEAAPRSDYAHLTWESSRTDEVAKAVWLKGQAFIYREGEWSQVDPETLWPLMHPTLAPDEWLVERLSEAPVQREGPLQQTYRDESVTVWVYTAEALWQEEIPAQLTVSVDARNHWPLSAQWTEAESGAPLAEESFFDHDQAVKIIQPEIGPAPGETQPPAAELPLPMEDARVVPLRPELVVDYRAELLEALKQLNLSKSFREEVYDRSGVKLWAEVLPTETYAHGFYTDPQANTPTEFLLIGEQRYTWTGEKWEIEDSPSEVLWNALIPYNFIAENLLSDPPVTRQGPISDEGGDIYVYTAQVQWSSRSTALLEVNVRTEDRRPVRIRWIDPQTEEILREYNYFGFDEPIEEIRP
ncbi:MAG: ABC transporter substrate-binding protein [Chloroflexi bacterium]|nr:ABC transporter substrate-binding protein [Chloroflexota bacterium]